MAAMTSRRLPIIEHPDVNPETLVDYAVYLFWDDEPTGCYFLVPIHEGEIVDPEEDIYEFYDVGLAILDGVIPQTINGEKIIGEEEWTQWTELSPRDPLHAYIARDVYDFVTP